MNDFDTVKRIINQSLNFMRSKYSTDKVKVAYAKASLYQIHSTVFGCAPGGIKSVGQEKKEAKNGVQ